MGAELQVSTPSGRARAPHRRIALLGGTFDPPHNGHLALATGVADELSLERVFLVPTGNPHFKLDAGVTPVEHRVAMTRLLAEEDERLEVSLIEAERAGVTYTADTLRELRRLYPKSHVFFIIGGDCAEHIMRWRNAAEVAQLCTVVAVARVGYDFKSAQRKLDDCGLGFDVRYLQLDIPDVSSTEVREAAARGAGLEGLVPKSVEDYIRQSGLYAG